MIFLFYRLITCKRASVTKALPMKVQAVIFDAARVDCSPDGRVVLGPGCALRSQHGGAGEEEERCENELGFSPCVAEQSGSNYRYPLFQADDLRDRRGLSQTQPYRSVAKPFGWLNGAALVEVAMSSGVM